VPALCEKGIALCEMETGLCEETAALCEAAGALCEEKRLFARSERRSARMDRPCAKWILTPVRCAALAACSAGGLMLPAARGRGLLGGAGAVRGAGCVVAPALLSRGAGRVADN